MRIAVMMIAVIGLSIACGDQDKTASSNGAVRVGAVASADEAVQSNRVERSDETTPDDEIAPSNGVEQSGAATPADESASPSSTGQAHGGIRSNKGRIPAPLRLRIYEATTIVRATLISSSPATVRYSADPGYVPNPDKESTEDTFPVDGEYRAIHTFRFRVSEYLKGSGASEITVKARQLGTHGTEAEALQVATESLASRDTSRDTHEAVLFLWEPTTDGALYFLISGAYPSLHYTIDTLNRVWLPAQDPPAAAGASSSDDSALLFLMGEQVSGLSWPTTMSLGELRSEVAAVDALLAAGDGTRGETAIAAMADVLGLEVNDFLLQAKMEAEDGIEWYRECIIESWRYEHAYEGLPEKSWTLEREFPLASGAPAGTVIEPLPSAGRNLIRGADVDLFEAALIDDDDRRDNGYEIGDATVRPLPAGIYRYKSYFQHISYVPCDFFPFFTYFNPKVVVTAPEGTLHELFFDPVTLAQDQSGPASSDTSNGVLKPATFTDANGASATIQSIAYESPSTGSGQSGAGSQSGTNTVKLKLSPHTSLANHVLDFIVLDGTVSLSLDVDEATVDAANNTLSWPVSPQPWQDGDKLMLRIRKGGE